MQCQGWTAYFKTLQESWPGYEMGTYMDGELTKQQAPSKAVTKSGSLDTTTPNPGNMMSTHGLL